MRWWWLSMRVQTLLDAMTPTQRQTTQRGNQKFTTQVLESFEFFFCIMKSADVTSTVNYTSKNREGTGEIIDHSQPYGIFTECALSL